MAASGLTETFLTDGGVAVRGLLDDEWIETLRDAMPELLARGSDPTSRSGIQGADMIISCDGMWKYCDAFRRFLFDSPLGGVTASVMRSNSARLYEDLLLYRDAAVAGAPAWHRDSIYWPVTGEQLANVWFSLEPVTSDTGAIRFVAGSHRDPDDIAFSTSDLEVGVIRDRRVVTVETEPGDVVVFHPRALHTAVGSASDIPRRTFTIRFSGDDVRWRPRSKFYHEWMRTCGLQKGDVLDHPGFPVVYAADSPAV